MNVVLADGSAVIVSATENPDLWWAMRGAGHNFGIVTSFHAKLHKRTDKLESVFAVLNEQQQNGGRPKELMNYGIFAWDSRFSTTEPIMQFFVYYVSTHNEAAPYLKPYQDLDPLFTNQSSVPYPDVLDATGTGLDNPLCEDGYTNMQFPFRLLEHNITATRQIYDYFANVLTAQPLYQWFVVVFECNKGSELGVYI
ncbi:hypothetical protein M426DRAFT_260232 [Hypoxylon sp. CI-4A]|nr:hypothetical protein M426DRAFT_260232 [Hypoxylon sp. CI-4A]